MLCGERYFQAQMERAGEFRDIDDAGCLFRRAWLVLVILDRWRSVSTSSMPLIPDHKIHLKDCDRQLLGKSAYNLVQLSCVLGHIVDVSSSTMSPDIALICTQITESLGKIERIRESDEWAFDQEPLLDVA